MNPDVSVAPEIAQLMQPPPPAAAGPGRTAAGPGPAAAGSGLTVGELARQLRLITGAPQQWWRLVRFDAERPVRVDIPTGGSSAAWLSILPPGAGDTEDCACHVATVVAGELTEHAIGPAPLLPGRVRVHGGNRPHRAVNRSDGYTVSIHLSGWPGQ